MRKIRAGIRPARICEDFISRKFGMTLSEIYSSEIVKIMIIDKLRIKN